VTDVKKDIKAQRELLFIKSMAKMFIIHPNYAINVKKRKYNEIKKKDER
jgi:hypothetical protein